MPYGHYNNTFDDVLANPSNEITWMKNNKVNPALYGWDYVSLYGMGGKLNSALAPHIYSLYSKRIRVGIACSRTSEVDAVLAYNASQSDYRKRIFFITTELEAEYANNNCTIAEYRTWIPQWYAKCKAAGVKLYVYEGWNYNYDVTVPNSDGFLLHAYRTSTQMANPDDMYKYMATAGDDRLVKIAAEGKKIGKRVRVSVLTSCEPAPANNGKGFGFDFYKTRPWGSALPIVQDAYNRLATTDIRNYTLLDGEFIFVSKYMHQIKP